MNFRQFARMHINRALMNGKPPSHGLMLFTAGAHGLPGYADTRFMARVGKDDD
jgi:hypothetical protein